MAFTLRFTDLTDYNNNIFVWIKIQDGHHLKKKC